MFFAHLEQHLNFVFGSCFIATFLLAMNGPRGVITCSRGLNGSNHWILHISNLRMGREQHVPDSSNHALFPENEGNF